MREHRSEKQRGREKGGREYGQYMSRQGDTREVSGGRRIGGPCRDLRERLTIVNS